MRDWKLIRRYEDGRVHLYNLKDDPSEKTDLADRELDRARRLAKKLDDWLRSANARFLREKDDRTPWRPSP